MKRQRGFRLGRKLAMVWRWAFRHRRARVGRCFFRPKQYLRLNSTAGADSPYDHSPGKFSVSSRPKASTMTTKFLDWARQLGRRLHSGGLSVGGKAYCRLGVPLIEEHDDAGDGWRKPPPKGFLAVYVGGKDDAGGGDEGEGGGRRRRRATRRYLVPVIYFNHPLFGELLREAEEEFGFHHPGGITIPCRTAEFERVRTRIASGHEDARRKGR